MILVVGETLVDLVLDTDDSIHAALGGAPSNTAVAVARLGAPVGFAGAISGDRFGRRLLARLVDDGVDVSHVVLVEQPTSLAMAELGSDGAASYRFYFGGTSVPELRELEIAGADVVVTGGLALVLEPMATVVERSVASASVPVVVDVNCRPAVVDDLGAYRARVERIVSSSAVVKVSDEDLDVLSPGAPPTDSARRLLDLGAGAVVVTRGASVTTVLTPDGMVEVPVAPLPAGAAVVDTIGAGDTFGAGLVTSLFERGAFAGGAEAIDLDALVVAVELGHAAAAVTVTRRGADPPRRHELRAF